MNSYEQLKKDLFKENGKVLKEYYKLEMLYNIYREILSYLAESNVTLKSLAKKADVNYRKLKGFMSKRKNIGINEISDIIGIIKYKGEAHDD